MRYSIIEVNRKDVSEQHTHSHSSNIDDAWRVALSNEKLYTDFTFHVQCGSTLIPKPSYISET